MLDLTQNYFELFQLSRTYALDDETLSKRYQALQRYVHPDRYSRASEQERRLAMQGAAFVNEAHRTLSDPLQRAKYLLLLDAYPLNESEQDRIDPDFLMQQMELREQLDEIGQRSDSRGDLAELQMNIKRQLDCLLSEMQGAFLGSDLQKAAALLQKAWFLDKLQQDTEELVLRFEDIEA